MGGDIEAGHQNGAANGHAAGKDAHFMEPSGPPLGSKKRTALSTAFLSAGMPVTFKVRGLHSVSLGRWLPGCSRLSPAHRRSSWRWYH